MYEALLVVFLIVAIALVALIMLQQGKGADMGASFGAGASGTLFGSSGSANFMTRTTAILATLRRTRRTWRVHQHLLCTTLGRILVMPPPYCWVNTTAF